MKLTPVSFHNHCIVLAKLLLLENNPGIRFGL